MSSLEGCIKKAGKSLRVEDADAIRKIRDDIRGDMFAGGVTSDVANQQAVNEYLEILEEERQEILKQAEERGGLLADKSLSPSEFARQTAQLLEDRARDFAAAGLQRSKDKSNRLKMLMMLPEEIHKVLEHFDPELAAEVLKAHGGMTAMKKLRGQAVVDVTDIYLEHITPFIKGSRKVPLRYSMTPQDRTTRDLLDAAPAYPGLDMQAHGRMLDEAEKAADVKPKDVRGILDSITKSGTSTSAKDVLLSLVPQRYIADFVKYGMTAVNYYVARLKDMNTYVENLMAEHAEISDAWSKFNKKAKAVSTDASRLLGKMMHTSTLAGVDMLEFSKQNPDEAAYKKMNKQDRKMWDVRRAAHAELIKDWEALGAIGENVLYEKYVYQNGTVNAKGDPVDGKLVKVSSENLPEGHAIYARVRDSYAAMRARNIEGLEQRITATIEDKALRRSRIAELRQMFENGKIGPYFPLSRFGKYAAVAKDPETGEVIGFFKRENRAERNRLVEELHNQGYRAYPIDEIDSDAALVKKIDPDFVAKVMTMIGVEMQGQDGKPSKEALSMMDDIWQMYLRSLPEMSVRKSFIKREGRLGFDRDAMRAFGDNMFHGAHQAGKLKYGYILSSLLEDADAEAKMLVGRANHIKNAKDGMMQRGHEGETLHEYMMSTIIEYRERYEIGIAKDPTDLNLADRLTEDILKEAEVDGPWAVPIYNSLSKRHDYNMNPKSAAWATNMTAFGFLWFLSTSPAAAALNLTQTAILGLPVLGAAFNMRGAGMELLRASMQYAASGQVISGTFGSKLRNVEYVDSDGNTKEREYGEKAAMIAFAPMTAKTRTRELSEIAVSGSKHNDKMHKIVEVAGWMFHKSEEANRMVTSLAAYRLALKKFASDKSLSESERHNAAVELAEKLTYDAHFDYGSTNRPPIMQGDLGKVVFLFRNYSVNMQYRLARDFRDGVWKNNNIPIEQRREARRRFAGIMTMTSMFAGLAGWPLGWAVHGILDMLLGDDDDPFDSRTEFRVFLTETVGELMGEAIYKGPWDAFTGLSLSSRTSLNNLWIREIPESLSNREKVTQLFAEIAGGPLGSMVFGAAQGFDELGEGNTSRAIEKWVPKAFSDAAKTLRYGLHGAQNRDLDMILPAEAFDPSSFSGSWSLLGQFMGFVPSELTKQYEQNRAVMDMSSRLGRRHQNLLNRYFTASKLGDRKAAREALEDIMSWNKANPRYAIYPATLRASAKSRAAYDMRTVGGIAVDKRLAYLHETLRFTKRK